MHYHWPYTAWVHSSGFLPTTLGLWLACSQWSAQPLLSCSSRSSSWWWDPWLETLTGYGTLYSGWKKTAQESDFFFPFPTDQRQPPHLLRQRLPAAWIPLLPPQEPDQGKERKIPAGCQHGRKRKHGSVPDRWWREWIHTKRLQGLRPVTGKK